MWKLRKRHGHIKGEYECAEETKRRISESNKGKSRNKGNENGMYKHGRYSIRRIIFEEIKKDYCCELCGSIENIEIHHKDLNRFNNKINNIMVLCKSCHSKQHRGKEHMIYVRSFK